MTNSERKYFMETRRLGFSVWMEGDFPLAWSLWGNSNVTRFIDKKEQLTEEDVKIKLRREMENHRIYSVQYWPLFSLATGEFVGCCGLKPLDIKKGVYELGFHLRIEFWGQKLAYEAAAAVVAQARNTVKITKIVAGHHPENGSSEKILIKLGFKFVGDHLFEPTELMHPTYEIDLNK